VAGTHGPEGQAAFSCGRPLSAAPTALADKEVGGAWYLVARVGRRVSHRKPILNHRAWRLLRGFTHLIREGLLLAFCHTTLDINPHVWVIALANDG
jgi:hypothetical protein